MTFRSGSFIASLRWLVPVVGLALVLAAVAGCSSKSKPMPTREQQEQADLTEYEAQIREVIPDSARAAKLITLTREFQTLVKQGVASIKDYRTKVAALNSNYEAARADYEALFSQQETARDAFLKKATVIREQAAALVTDAEWEQLRKARLRALDAALEELIVLKPSAPVVLTSHPPYSWSQREHMPC